MTREEALGKHRAIWHVISELLSSPDKLFEANKQWKEEEPDEREYLNLTECVAYLKQYAIKKMFPGEEGLILCDCYLCDYSIEQAINAGINVTRKCRYCPCCLHIPCLDGLYDKFRDALDDEDYSKAAAYAKAIEEKEEVSK